MSFDREKLINDYIPFADKLASIRKRSLPKFIDLEELRSAAYLGLVEAARRYDPQYGTSFSTFAYRRIFGSLQDFLREQGFGRRGEKVKMQSLEGEDNILKDAVASKPDHRYDEVLELIESKIDQQAKNIIRSYVFEDLSMKETGMKFKLSEGRISQLMKQYKQNLLDQGEEFARELAA